MSGGTRRSRPDCAHVRAGCPPPPKHLDQLRRGWQAQSLEPSLKRPSGHSKCSGHVGYAARSLSTGQAHQCVALRPAQLRGSEERMQLPRARCVGKTSHLSAYLKQCELQGLRACGRSSDDRASLCSRGTPDWLEHPPFMAFREHDSSVPHRDQSKKGAQAGESRRGGAKARGDGNIDDEAIGQRVRPRDEQRSEIIRVMHLDARARPESPARPAPSVLIFTGDRNRSRCSAIHVCSKLRIDQRTDEREGLHACSSAAKELVRLAPPRRSGAGKELSRRVPASKGAIGRRFDRLAISRPREVAPRVASTGLTPAIGGRICLAETRERRLPARWVSCNIVRSACWQPRDDSPGARSQRRFP